MNGKSQPSGRKTGVSIVFICLPSSRVSLLSRRRWRKLFTSGPKRGVRRSDAASAESAERAIMPELTRGRTGYCGSESGLRTLGVWKLNRFDAGPARRRSSPWSRRGLPATSPARTPSWISSTSAEKTSIPVYLWKSQHPGDNGSRDRKSHYPAGNAQAWSWHSGFVEGAAKRQGHFFGLPDRGKSAK